MMVAATADLLDRAIRAPRRGGGWWLTGMTEMAKRNIRHIVRSPELVSYGLIQPVMFILLFTYVFGGAMQVPGSDYKQFLLPGIFVQLVLFGSVAGATVGVATDMQIGLMDRFRSMPISRSSVLVGRTTSEVLRNVVSLTVMVAVGLLIGFRFLDGIGPALGGLALLLFFGFALTWLGAYVGLLVSSPEAAQGAGLTWMFPFSFISSAFVPTETMPGWLQAYAERSPMTTMVNSLRGLFNGDPVGSDIVQTIAWSVGIIVVFAPLAVRKYRTRSL